MPLNKAFGLAVEALALRTGVASDDPYLRAAAIGCLVAGDRLYQVAAAGFGSVRIFFEHHHLATPPVAFEMSDALPAEFRDLMGE